VFKYLADHPDDGFTLSELARRLDLNKATCHSMFNALESHGLLLRHPTLKTYRLGPALIGLAQAVGPVRGVALDTARSVMGQLTDELDLGTFATTVVGNEVVVLARRLPPHYVSPTGHVPPVGSRTKWTPPVAPMFAAWGPAAQREQWLASAADDATRSRLELELGQMRQRGYDMTVADDTRSRILRSLAELPDDPTALRAFVTSLLDQAEQGNGAPAGGAQRIHAITAPAFGSDGTLLMSITIDGFRAAMRRRQAEEYAAHLLSAVSDLTVALQGRFPADWPARTGTGRNGAER
jgi:DNA-binding IclR family transcriptional regulator